MYQKPRATKTNVCDVIKYSIPTTRSNSSLQLGHVDRLLGVHPHQEVSMATLLVGAGHEDVATGAQLKWSGNLPDVGVDAAGGHLLVPLEVPARQPLPFLVFLW